MRRMSVAAEYFLSGVNAISHDGRARGMRRHRQSGWCLALCGQESGADLRLNKIVPTLQDAMRRIFEYVYPFEDARSRKVNGMPSQIGKCVTVANERQPGRINLILVDETLGY